MASTTIALTADQALSHASNLLQASSEVPDSTWVTSSMAGASSVEAEKNFHAWLAKRAAALGKSADELTKAVTQNADALRQAAQDLLERDAVSADVATRFTAALNSSNAAAATASAPDAKKNAADGPAPKTVPAAKTVPVPSPTATPTPAPAGDSGYQISSSSGKH